jgi:hypothetical protein
MQIYCKVIKVNCPYCNRKLSLSLRLCNEEDEQIITCQHNPCKKKFVLTYNALIQYKIHKLVGE